MSDVPELDYPNGLWGLKALKAMWCKQKPDKSLSVKL